MSTVDVLLCLAPIAGLVVASVCTRWSTGVTLPLAAVAMFAVRTMALSMDPLQTSAAIVSGLHEALVPLSIVFGAIFLFKSMECTGCMDFMVERMVAVTGGDRVPQLLLLGWSFMTLLEGSSGFGTPIIAIAPVLVRLGHESDAAILFLLITNSLVTVFGAAGTPMWYGFGQVPVDDDELVQTGFVAACAIGLLSFVLLPIACAMATSKEEARKHWRLIAFSATCGIVPMVITARWSYTFPAIVAGGVGCLATYQMIRYQKGGDAQGPGVLETLKRTAPITVTVLLLLLSRIPQVGLKDLLTRTTPSFTLRLGTYGDVSLSASLVYQLKSILTTDVNFRFQLLFVPFIIPFMVTGLSTMLAYSCWRSVSGTLAASARQVVHPAQTLFGALVLVELMVTGEDSPASLIGDTISTSLGDAWLVLAPFIGSLGSFVAGSTTISNLTFGLIQYAASVNIAFDTPTVLALQCCGASIGTSVCIYHCVAAGAAVGQEVSVKHFMRKLGPLVLIADILAVGIAIGIGALVQ
ncbi:L-lactate permease [Tribonema minus]|uniref:L-lactate permease n=1 Tax=Tribonema minus TaxID=303371 RepID=A0A835Z168_9STRA|nr:L-lactate permease [Tribonema minus]